LAADLGGEGHHAAEDFAERGDVVGGDPLGEEEEFVGEEWGVVEDLLEGFDFDVGGWRVVVDADDDAHEALAAEGDEDAGADCGGDAVDRVGEVAVERDGEGDIAVTGHLD
jgi:hypothetical protein